MPLIAGKRRFDGKIVIVTGAAHGLGRGIATAFAREGGMVYGFDVDAAGLAVVERSVRAEGGQLIGVACDVSRSADILRSVGQVLAEAGCVDVLVNNAGINMTKRIAELESEDWDRVFDTNLKSVYAMCRAVWPGLQAQRSGAVVNVASIMGQVGGVGSPAYCATKAGIIMFSRCLAKDGAEFGIRVNSVCPGYIDTPIMDRVLQAMPDPAKARRELVARLPLGRMGTPDDIAMATLFLASDDAAYISGTELTIDGAVTATQID